MVIPEEIRNILKYDPETGRLIRLVSRKAYAAGTIAGTVSMRGYINIMFRGRKLTAHRVAWFLMTGSQPPDCIDHADGDKTNNRWDNLREATRSQNAANRKRVEHNNLPKGVTRHRRGRYQAQVKARGEYYYLGLFATASEAAEAYALKAKELHGRFARLE